MKNRKIGLLLNFIFCLSLFYTAIFFSWQTLSLIDFGYSSLYDRLDIDEMAQKYPPANEDINKRMFIFTEREEHERLFGEIVKSINNGGVGLEDIVFRIPQTKQAFTLLNREEVLHLVDVADVVTWFKRGAYFFMLAAAACFAAMLRLGISPARLRIAIPATVGFLGASGLLIQLVGAKAVFYFLHEVVFTGSKWFFYYQESLMTVLMHAPDIFGWITLLLVFWAFVVYCTLLYFLGYIHKTVRGTA